MYIVLRINITIYILCRRLNSYQHHLASPLLQKPGNTERAATGARKYRATWNRCDLCPVT